SRRWFRPSRDRPTARTWPRVLRRDRGCRRRAGRRRTPQSALASMTGCSHACRGRRPENPLPRAAQSVAANRTRTPGSRAAERSTARRRPRRKATSDRRHRRTPPEARTRHQGAQSLPRGRDCLFLWAYWTYSSPCSRSVDAVECRRRVAEVAFTNFKSPDATDRFRGHASCNANTNGLRQCFETIEESIRSLRSGRSRASGARLGEITDDRRTWPDGDVQRLEIGITTYGERGGAVRC